MCDNIYVIFANMFLYIQTVKKKFSNFGKLYLHSFPVKMIKLNREQRQKLTNVVQKKYFDKGTILCVCHLHIGVCKSNTANKRVNK